ncbi:MAG: hypothetical protein QM790_11600 [Nibricoccus sp.]
MHPKNTVRQIKWFGYTERKLVGYIETLASHPGDAGQRVMSLFEHMVPVLNERDFPPEEYAEWLAINKEVRKFGPYCDVLGRTIWSDVEHTMRRVKNRTASKIAKRVLTCITGSKEMKPETNQAL